MQAHGSDRVRAAGGRFILHSRIPKGWTPRSLKTLTKPEHPGTTVLWEGEHFEVVAAEALPSGGVRYVLAPWRDELTIRTFEAYDEESEARRHADHELVMGQRRRSVAGKLAGVVLGNCPAGVQIHLSHELGVSPQRMTLLSAIPPVVLLGICFWFIAGAIMGQGPLRIPTWLAFVAVALAFESLIRFIITMSTGRPFGSLLGVTLYSLLWLVVPARYGWPSPSRGERGYSTSFTIAPDEETAFRDSYAMRAPLLPLLPARDQQSLAEAHGFDYREHATSVAAVLLVCSVIGAVSMASAMVDEVTLSRVISFIAAIVIAVEQVWRLASFSRGPAGSILGYLVRPFVRDLLEARPQTPPEA